MVVERTFEREFTRIAAVKDHSFYYSGYCKYRSIKMSDFFSQATQVCISTGAPYATQNKNYKISKNSSLVGRSEQCVYRMYFVIFTVNIRELKIYNANW
jgi:hypothetical protein